MDATTGVVASAPNPGTAAPTNQASPNWTDLTSILFNDNADSDGDGTPDSMDGSPYANDTRDSDLDGRPDDYDREPFVDQINDRDHDYTPDGYDSAPNDDRDY